MLAEHQPATISRMWWDVSNAPRPPSPLLDLPLGPVKPGHYGQVVRTARSCTGLRRAGQQMRAETGAARCVEDQRDGPVSFLASFMFVHRRR